MRQGISPSSSETGQLDAHIGNAGDTSKETGIILVAYSAALVLGSIILGYIGDKMSRRKWPMMSGVIVLFGSIFLFLFGTEFWMLALARALQGFANTCIWTLGISMVACSFPANVLGSALSKCVWAFSVGLAAGAPVGGTDFAFRLFLIERQNNPKELLGSTNIPDPCRQNECVSRNMADSSFSFDNNPSIERSPIIRSEKSEKAKDLTMVQILRFPRFLTSLLAAFSYGFVFNVFEATMSVRLAEEWGYNSSQIGLVFLVQLVPTLASTPISGIIYDRYGPKLLSFASLVMNGICIVLMGVPNRSSPGGVVPLIVLFGLEGFFSVGYFVPVMPEIANSVRTLINGEEEITARCYGIFNIAFGLGAIAGPLLGSYLYAQIGFFWMCITIACVLFLTAPFALLFLGEKQLYCIKRRTENLNSRM
ncbi:major facilitator superfamily domain-containing protein [Fennellomyces sp. T-0311]|nr:major facilitator superfamily domain-containing protein [Fennellomyces sp. T-0311]